MSFKICRDCKYHSFDAGHLITMHWCSNPRLHPVDLVNGYVGCVPCEYGRNRPENVFICGPEGKLWEPREGDS